MAMLKKLQSIFTSMLFPFISSSDVTTDFFCIGIPILTQICLVP